METHPANLPDLGSVRDPPRGTGPNGSNLAPGGTAPLKQEQTACSRTEFYLNLLF